MFSDFVAGISFTDDIAHLAILEIKKHSLRVRYLDEIPRSGSNDLWFLDRLLAKEQRIIRKVSKVSVAIDPAAMFLHIFPTDTSLTQTEQNEHIAWEFSNYIPDFQPKEYIRDVHILKTHAQAKVAELFVIAARRTFVTQIQDALAGKKFELYLADMTHFGAQYALEVNYPEAKSKTIALVSVAKDRTDIGFINHGKLVQYSYRDTASTESVLDFIKGELGKHLASDLFFFGNSASAALVNTARQLFPISVEMLNPLKKIPAASSLDIEGLRGLEYRFAPAIGCALRKQ